MVQTETGLGETIPWPPCLASGFGTHRRNLPSMTAGHVLDELVLSFLFLPTQMGRDMGASLVTPHQYPIRLACFWVSGVLVLSFLEAVKVV